jgi:RNA polymerase sigma-B factor
MVWPLPSPLEYLPGVAPLIADQSRVDQLIQDHLPLARALAARYRNRGESQEDLVQVAYLGLVMAARRYHEGAGGGFAAYAIPTITGELRRHFRDKGWAVRPPRRLQDIQASVRAAGEALTQQLSREPTPTEVGEYLGVETAELMQARVAAGGYTTRSLDVPIGSEAGQWAEQMPAQPPAEESLDHLVDAISLESLLRELPAREQRIIAMRYYGGWTQQQIADQIGVTQMQVSRLLAQSLNRLRSAIDAPDQIGA